MENNITYIKGSATNPNGTGNKIIVHSKTNNKTINLVKLNNKKDFRENYGKNLFYEEERC